MAMGDWWGRGCSRWGRGDGVKVGMGREGGRKRGMEIMTSRDRTRSDWEGRDWTKYVWGGCLVHFYSERVDCMLCVVRYWRSMRVIYGSPATARRVNRLPPSISTFLILYSIRGWTLGAFSNNISFGILSLLACT